MIKLIVLALLIVAVVFGYHQAFLQHEAVDVQAALLSGLIHAAGFFALVYALWFLWCFIRTPFRIAKATEATAQHAAAIAASTAATARNTAGATPSAAPAPSVRRPARAVPGMPAAPRRISRG